FEPGLAFPGAQFANQIHFARRGNLEDEFLRRPGRIADELLGSLAARNTNARSRACSARSRRHTQRFGLRRKAILSRLEENSAAPGGDTTARAGLDLERGMSVIAGRTKGGLRFANIDFRVPSRNAGH